MESLQYELTPKSFKALKEDEVPEDLITLLKPLKNEKFKTKVLFTTQLEEILGKDNVSLYLPVILKHTEAAGRFNKEGYGVFFRKYYSY